MQGNIYKLEESIQIGDYIITPFIHIFINYFLIKGNINVYAFKIPIYIIIRKREFSRICRITGEELSIDLAISECPALAVALQDKSSESHLRSDR
jgi:hypothetical protein